MARAHSHGIAALVLVVSAAGCAGDRPPADLSGLWSAGPAACAAGVGVRFGKDSIAAVYDTQRETLFDHPQYRVEAGGEHFRVRILYDLPRSPGASYGAGGYGVLVLERNGDGELRPASHNFIDRRTGSARLRIADDPAMSALTLKPCAPHPWIEGLRGRGDT